MSIDVAIISTIPSTVMRACIMSGMVGVADIYATAVKCPPGQCFAFRLDLSLKFSKRPQNNPPTIKTARVMCGICVDVAADILRDPHQVRIAYERLAY